MLLYGIATNGIQTIQSARELNIPVIFRALDIVHRLIKIPIIRHWAKRYEKYVINNSNLVLITTPELGRYVNSMGAKKENIETFQLGINLKLFSPLPKNSKLLTKYGLSKNDKVIVFMGTLYNFSGLDDIILDFDILKNSITDIKLLIVGGGPSMTHLQNLIKN